MILKSKKLVLFIIFLVCICISSLSHAVVGNNKYYDSMYDDNTIITEVPEEFLDIIYACDTYKAGDYHLMVTKNDITAYKVYFIPKIENLKVYCDGSNFYFSPTAPGVKVYKGTSSGLGGLIGTYNFTKEQYMHTSANLFYADFDVYTDNTYSSFFFQAEGHKIMTITGVEQIPKTIMGVMKVIIPVGLVVLSMVLIISLIQLVISRMT